MADYPALPLWTDKYFADTRHLSRDQHGAYLLLLMEAWRRPSCSLPDNDVLLARLTCSTMEEWMDLKPVVMAFWRIDGRSKEWTQKALSKEREFLVKQSKSQRDRAAKRWKETTKADAGKMPDECPPDAPTPTPTPTIEELPLEAPARESTPLQILSEALGEETAKAVMAHRKAKRAPVSTPLAARGLVKGFREFPGGPIAAAEMMVTNGWTGFKREYWDKGGGGSRASPSYESVLDRRSRELKERIENEFGTGSDRAGSTESSRQLPRLVDHRSDR
jgi:uncharacterized protein YdaU (DUF1376 family)